VGMRIDRVRAAPARLTGPGGGLTRVCRQDFVQSRIDSLRVAPFQLLCGRVFWPVGVDGDAHSPTALLDLAARGLEERLFGGPAEKAKHPGWCRSFSWAGVGAFPWVFVH